MTFSLLGTARTNGTDTASTRTTDDAVGFRNTTGAKLFVVAFHGNLGSTTTINDNAGNAYQLLDLGASSENRNRLYYCINPSTRTDHSWNVSGSSMFGFLTVSYWGNTADVVGVDVSNSASGSGSTRATGSVTPGWSESLLIAVGVTAGSGSSFAINGGFTIGADNSRGLETGLNFGGAQAHLIQTAIAAANPTWTFPGSGNNAAGIVVFRGSDGVSGGPPPPVITGPSGAAGAANSTANIAENATTGPTFSTNASLGAGFPSLTGAQAANWAITTLSSTSWRVDPVAPFDFEAGGLVNPQVFVFNAAAGVSQTCTVTVTNQSEPPLAPTIGSATAGNGSATVAFTPPNNAGRPAITLFTATSTPGGITGTGTSSPIAVSGLTNGVSYTFNVRAANADGTGPASAESNSVTPSAGGDTTPPTLTGSITIGTVTSTSIQFSWPAGSDNVAVVGYDVSSNGGSSWTSLGNVLTHTFSSLTPSTAYQLRVRARDAAGNVSTPALSASQSTNPAGTFSATVGPFSLNTGSPALSSGTLSFTAISGDAGTSGSVISGSVSIGGGGTGTISSFPSAGLWQVNLRNADGSGRWHNVVTAA